MGLAGLTPDAVVVRYEGQQYGRFKTDLAELAVSVIEPIQARHQALRQDEAMLGDIMHQGAKKARAVAEKTLANVYDVVGLLR